MSDILIKEAKMPSSCVQCPCRDDSVNFCRAAKKYIPMLGKPKFCPLVEIPPHGRLIDADKLKDKINIAFLSEIGKVIDDAPTVIGSEEE